MLVGISEGADVAVTMATKIPAVTHIMLIGSGGYTMRQSLKLLKEKGDIPFVVNIDKGLKQIKSDPNSIKKMWFGNPYRWWNDVIDYDPMESYMKVKIPILLAIGEKDSSVPVESVRYLEEAFKKAGKVNLDVVIYPNANHRLQVGDTDYRDDFFSKLDKLLD